MGGDGSNAGDGSTPWQVWQFLESWAGPFLAWVAANLLTQVRGLRLGRRCLPAEVSLMDCWPHLARSTEVRGLVSGRLGNSQMPRT